MTETPVREYVYTIAYHDSDNLWVFPVVTHIQTDRFPDISYVAPFWDNSRWARQHYRKFTNVDIPMETFQILKVHHTVFFKSVGHANDVLPGGVGAALLDRNSKIKSIFKCHS